MLTFIEPTLFEKLRSAQALPSPGGVRLTIMRLCAQDDPDMAELIHLVQADPALSAQQRLDYERLLVALSELEPDFRAVIVLRDIDECDYEQMAGILDVPVGTVKSRLFRARSALRERLRPDGRLPA